MTNPSGSKASLFLMEMIVTIFFFSIASAVCTQCFMNAHLLCKDTEELNHAISIATGFAEVMRGTDGKIDSIIKVYPNAVKGDDSFFEVYYDENFNICTHDEAKYVGDVTLTPNGAIQNMDIIIAKLDGDSADIIYTLTATKYMHAPQG